MRALLILLASLSALACGTPRAPARVLKQVFVEPGQVADGPVTGWPFSPQDEERCYEAVRSLREGRAEGRRKLALLINQWTPPKRKADGTIAPISTVVVIKRDDHPRGLPDIVFFPARDDIREESGVYVGHSVFKQDVWTPGSALVHHLRFLVINRDAFGLKLSADSIELGVAASDGEEAVVGGEFTLLAAANERGEAIRSLYIEPGGRALVHAFFRARRLGRHLHLRWTLEEGQAPVGRGLGVSDEEDSDGSEGELSPDLSSPKEAGPPPPSEPSRLPEPEGPPDQLGGDLPPDAPLGALPPEDETGRSAGPPEEKQDERRWSFSALLSRRYVISEGVLTPLERSVAGEQPLPEPADGDYTEPRVTPLGPR